MVFEDKLPMFVVEGGEFLDAGEDAVECIGAGIGPSKFEGVIVKLLIDCFPDAGGLGEISAFFDIMDGIEDFLATSDKIEGVQPGTEALEGHVMNIQSEAVWRWSGDTLLQFAHAGGL